jgi:hypothetical protein
VGWEDAPLVKGPLAGLIAIQVSWLSKLLRIEFEPKWRNVVFKIVVAIAFLALDFSLWRIYIIEYFANSITDSYAVVRGIFIWKWVLLILLLCTFRTKGSVDCIRLFMYSIILFNVAYILQELIQDGLVLGPSIAFSKILSLDQYWDEWRLYFYLLFIPVFLASILFEFYQFQTKRVRS